MFVRNPRVPPSRVSVEVLQNTGVVLDRFARVGPTPPLCAPIVGGALPALFYAASPMTALHEAGHVLAAHILYTDPFGVNHLTYQVDLIDNLKTLAASSDVSEFSHAFVKVLKGYDANADGARGVVTYIPAKEGLNALGRTLSEPAQTALFSSMGSMAEWGLNIGSMCAGLALYHRHAQMGAFLLCASGVQHLASSAYPLRAAFLDAGSDAWKESLEKGDDWVSVAEQWHHMTGISRGAAASLAATGYLLSWPLLYWGLYAWMRSDRAHVVPDKMAVAQWIFEHKGPYATARSRRMFDAYPDKDQWQGSVQALKQALVSGRGVAISWEAWSQEYEKLQTYVYQQLSQKELRHVKEGLLRDWNVLAAPSPIEPWFVRASCVSKALSLSLPVWRVLGPFSPACAHVARGLTYAMPALSTAIALRQAYTSFKELYAPEEVIPRPSKVVSATKLCVSLVGFSMVCLSLFDAAPAQWWFAVPVAMFFIQVGLSLFHNSHVRSALKKSTEADRTWEIRNLERLLDDMPAVTSSQVEGARPPSSSMNPTEAEIPAQLQYV